MSVIMRTFIHTVLLAAGLNIIVLVLVGCHADVPILLKVLQALGHWHYLTLAFVTAAVLNRQLLLMASGVFLIALCVVHRADFQVTELLLPVAAGILLGMGVQAALQEAMGPPVPPAAPPVKGGP